MRHIRFLKLSALLLSVILSLADAFAIDDPASFQKSAIARIDAFVDNFRKTGDFQSRLPDLQIAEQELILSQAAFVEEGKLADAAHSLIRLGQIQRMRGQWSVAITIYQQALNTAQVAQAPLMQAKALIGMTQAEMSLPDLGAAEEHISQAIKLSEGITDNKLRFDVLDIAAQVQIAQSNFNAALTLLNRAFEVAGRVEDESSLFYGYLDRADVYLKLAEKCDVDRSFETCLEAAEHSRADYLEAQRLANKLGYTGLAATTADFLRQLELRKQLIISQQAMDSAVRKTPIFSPKASEDILITEHFTSGGTFPPAVEAFYQKYKTEARNYGGFNDLAAARNSFIEGMMQQSQGQHDVALKSFLKAVEKLELDRGKLRDERDRGSFVEDKIVFYNAAILQLLEHRRYTEAFELLERSRARAMVDMLASRPPELTKPAERALYGEIMNLKAKIANSQSKITAITSENQPQAIQQLKATNAEIEQMESQLAKLNKRLKEESPKLGELLQPPTTSLQSLQKAMQEENFEMLQYMLLESGLILWHITPDQIHVLNVFIPRSQLQEKIRKLKDSISHPNADFDQQAAQELYLYLIEPAKKWIKTNHLVIVPNEDLFSVPFQALPDPKDGRFVGESYALSYAPSATVLLSLRPSGPMARGRLLAAADPDLGAAVREVKAISTLYPDNSLVLSQSLAGEADIKKQVGDYDLIHLAVHGKFAANEPMLSHLKLAPGGGDDGNLTAAEMFGLPLEKSKLVVLSACETARANVTVGNEVQGMLRALLYAGANSLLMSYWRVDSEATANWMTTFYQAAQSKSPAEAARQAMISVKAQDGFNQPYYWAAFMTVGR